MRSIHFLLFSLLTSITVGIFAASAADPGVPVNAKHHPLAGRVDFRLLPAIDAYRAKTATEAQAAASVKAAHGRLVAKTLRAEQLAISIDTKVTADVLKAIADTGATIVGSYPQWNTVSVLATVSQIDALTQIGTLNSLKLQTRPRTRQQGLAPNQADSLMHTDTLRTPSYGLTGAGQTVGVISDSVHDTGAVGAGITTGTVPNAFLTNTTPQTDAGTGGTHDLPSSIQIVDFGPGGGTDEGEGMMEVIHDIAPGAALAFASVGTTQTSMATNLLSLRTAAHCTVTCDDIGFPDEPFFQDGPISQAITTNRSAGVLHFSAYGNDGNRGILTTYKCITSSIGDNKASPPDGTNLHDWGNGVGAYLPVRIPAGASVNFILQWDQPFQRFGLGVGSNADLDLYLCSAPNLASVASTGFFSIDLQGGIGAPSGDPVEIVSYTNTGAAVTMYLVIDHYNGSRVSSTGSGGNVMRIVFDDDGFGTTVATGSNPNGMNQMTTFGHPSSKDCVGVGAIDCHAPTLPERFSSKGGAIPYYFLPNGTASASIRNGPDIAAIDGVDTSVFGGSDSDADGHPNFFGTSCATPNATAVAALLLQANPMPPTQLLTVMKTHATDITTPPTTDPSFSMGGFDAYTGAGLVNGLLSYQSFGPATITSALTVNANVGSPFSYTLTANGPRIITLGITGVSAPFTLTGATITGTPTAQGPVMVTLTASNGNGTDTKPLTINVGPPIPVTINSGPTVFPSPTVVNTNASFNVSATGSGQGLTYSWNFGDGTALGSGMSVAHVYTQVGNYTATVTIVDVNNQSAMGQVAVHVIYPPLIFTQSSTATPNPQFATVPLQFSSLAGGGVPPITYSWDFGDTQAGVGTTPTHAYAAPGVYAASVTIKDSVGQSNTGNLSVTIMPFTTMAYTSLPSATPNPAGIGQTVNFSAGAVGNGTVSYAWDFGDGTGGSGASVSHDYNSSQTFTATVTASDSTQQQLSSTVAVVVKQPLVGTGTDSDGDGVSNVIEALAGTNANDPNSSPLINALAQPASLSIAKMMVRLNLARTGSDSITLSGVLPIPAGFAVGGNILVFNIGGVTDSLSLDTRGRGVNGNGETFTLTIKKTKNVIAAQSAKFALTLSRGSFASQLASSGLTNATLKNANVSVLVQFIFNGILTQTSKSLLYTAKLNKTATAK